jgi:hypothetical protein
LRYAAYGRDNNLTDEFKLNSGDYFDELPNCHVFGLYIAGKLMSSIRVHILDSSNPVSPTMSIFPELLEHRIESGATFVDPSRFVVDQETARYYPELIYATLRLALMATCYFDTEYCLATARPEHNAFYSKVFLLETMSETRLYPSLTKAVNMMVARMSDVRDRIIAKYPIFDSHYIEQRMLFNADHWPTLPARHRAIGSMANFRQVDSPAMANFAGLQ